MAAYTIVPIEHNIKQAITAAVKAVEFKKYHVEADEVVDNLLADIFRTLFPNNPSLVDVTKVDVVSVPIVPPPAPEAVDLPVSPKKPAKEKKPRAKKEKEPEPVPEPAVANAAAGSASATEPEKEKPKKKAPAKKEKSEAQNLDKLNPTQKKVLKKESVEDAKAFLDFVNAMSGEEYRAKTFEEHVQEFKKPRISVVEYVEPECIEVMHNGKTYFVDPDTNKVYVQDGEVDKLVGHVGMLEFAGMVVPTA